MDKPVSSIAYARVGLLGNPSDGYGGKALAACIKNFRAEVSLQSSNEMSFPAPESHQSIGSLVSHCSSYGYYGADRLMRAALKRFCENAALNKEEAKQALSFELNTTIPRQLGLAGSSAIVTASLKALCQQFGRELPAERLAMQALLSETAELGIEAGPQDRFAQAFGGIVAMDFSSETPSCEQITIPSDYQFGLFCLPAQSKVSGEVLKPLRKRFEEQEPVVIETLEEIASLADQGRLLFASNSYQPEELGKLIARNFELRSRIMPLRQECLSLQKTLSTKGISSKFAGSGGSFLCLLTEAKQREYLISLAAEHQGNFYELSWGIYS